MTISRVLVVDDEPPARRRLTDLLASHPEVEEVGECSNGDEAVSELGRGAWDVVFLDVQMPGRDGFEVVAAVGAERMPAVVFVTAHDEYALAAFGVDAVDYLLKPFENERFWEAFRRARRRREGEGLATLRRELGEVLERSRRPAHVTVEKDGRLALLPIDRIDRVQAAGNYVEIHAGGRTVTVRATLGSVEEQLDSRRFVRIHRSHLVALDRIREIQRLFGGEHRVVLRDGTHLPLARRYRRRLPKLGAPA